MTKYGKAVDEEPEGDGVNASFPGWSANPLCNDVLENIQLLTYIRKQCSSLLDKEAGGRWVFQNQTSFLPPQQPVQGVVEAKKP